MLVVVFDKLLSGAALQTAMFSGVIGSNGATHCYLQPSMQVPLTWTNCT